jgi:hypothetical protein
MVLCRAASWVLQGMGACSVLVGPSRLCVVTAVVYGYGLTVSELANSQMSMYVA